MKEKMTFGIVVEDDGEEKIKLVNDGGTPAEFVALVAYAIANLTNENKKDSVKLAELIAMSVEKFYAEKPRD